MKYGYQTNTWGGVVGHPAGVTSIKDLFYLTPGSDEQALREIAGAGYTGVELFDGNLTAYKGREDVFKGYLKANALSLIAVYSVANFIYGDVLDDELWRIEEAAKIGLSFWCWAAAQCGRGAYARKTTKHSPVASTALPQWRRGAA